MKEYSSLKEKEKYYTCYTVDSLEELYSVLAEFEGRRMVFRGVREARFYNYTSALVRGVQMPQDEFDNLIANTIDLVWHNKRIAKLLQKQSDDRTDMQVLSLLQHYGFGTTILDFTYKFNYAVFFALDGMSYNPNESDSYSINNYFSIYLFDIDDDEHFSIQKLNVSSQDQLESSDREARYLLGKRYKGPTQYLHESYCKLPYRELASIGGGITIAGRYGGEMNIISPTTGIYVTYDVSNDRDDRQYGLFKLSPSANMAYEDIALNHYSLMPRHLFCINIHKSLQSALEETYLVPYNICKDSVYSKTRFYTIIIRELLKMPIDDRIVAPKHLVNLKSCTYDRLRRIAKKGDKG